MLETTAPTMVLLLTDLGGADGNIVDGPSLLAAEEFVEEMFVMGEEVEKSMGTLVGELLLGVDLAGVLVVDPLSL